MSSKITVKAVLF